MVGLKRIWREIAFDIEFRPTSVHLAAFFLTLIKDHDIPIQIYARFTYGDLSDPTLRCLLSNLREQTHRWETFLYWGRLGPYRSYLDLPAPALQEFSDDHDLSHLYSGQTTQLFAGHAPVLQSLVTLALGGWRSVTLTHLKTLDLWDCNTRLSMVSLLNFLRRTPQLEEINIVSPNPPVHDCTPGEVVSLLRLKDIRVQNPDFYSIVGHLAIPNVRAVAVYSIYTRGASGLQVGPAFQSPHPFVGFASIEAPLLGQAIIVTSFDVRAGSSNFTLAVSFVTEKKTSVCVSLEWAGVYIDGWMEYIKRSITTLARMGFRSGATLHVRTEGCTIDYSPLLRLGAFEYFSVDCQDLSKLLKALSYCQAPLLPNLKSLFALEGDLDNETINSLLKFLQSRRNLAVVFDSDAYMDLVRTLGDCCIIGSRFNSLEMISPLAQLTLLPTERTAQVPNLDQTPWPCAYVRLKDSQLIRQDSPLVLNP